MKIKNQIINSNSPTFFIAEIGSNFDQSEKRVFKLIELAKKAGADAVKFQHYTAESLVSDYGFNSLDQTKTHQTKWSDTVFNTYKNAEFNFDWTEKVSAFCKEQDLVFITSPYYLQVVEELKDLVDGFKVGSGDITWLQLIESLSETLKPLIIATGASTSSEVELALERATLHHENVSVLQCNTNYQSLGDNYKYLNINVLKSYHKRFPNLTLGLSEHNKSNLPVLAAVSLGARIIEKHFTDDDKREGPDHAFALTPVEWKNMVNQVRELEYILGTDEKKIEPNEISSSIVQKRSIRMNRQMDAGEVIEERHLCFLRPAPPGSLKPSELNLVVGRQLNRSLNLGEHITKDFLR
jgi:N-acetylneuraminate synthase